MMTQLATRSLDTVMSPSSGAYRRRDIAQPEDCRSAPALLLARFAPISLDQMEDVALLDRIDTKYVFHAEKLAQILAGLAEQYWILQIEGLRMHRYHTLYFDTADFELYRQHHAGLGNRYKVRSRHYVDSNLTCLEVKLKTNADRTIKHRTRTDRLITRMSPDVCASLREQLPLDPRGLQPRLQNDFVRITLVNRSHEERLTLDLDLQFSTGSRAVKLPGIVIAEVKRASGARTSEFVRLMREQHIRATGFSKYCIGVSLLYPELKHNNFKAHLRLLDKLMQGGSSGLY